MYIEVSGRTRMYCRRAWKLALWEGLVAIAIGLLLLFRPAGTLVFLMQVLGVYWLVSGFFKSIVSLTEEKHEGWWTRLAGGLVLIALGVLVLAYPALATTFTTTALIWTVASFAVVAGVLGIIWGFSLSSELPGEGWTVVSGILSIALGMVLFAAPFVTMQALALLVGLFALIGGAGQILFGLRLRRLGAGGRSRISGGRYVQR